MTSEGNANVACWADTNLESFGEYDALVYEARTWTSTEIHDQSCRLAQALLASGFAPGDRAVLVFPNVPEIVIAHAAVLRAGGVVVLLAPSSTPAEIQRVISHSGASTLLMTTDCEVKAQGSGSYGGVSLRIVFGARTSASPGWVRFEDLVKAHTPLPHAVSRTADDIAEIVYTSGTTDVPKGVIHTHGSLSARKSYLTLGRVSAELVVLPLAHGFGGRLFLRRLLLKVKVILMDHFDPHLVLENIERYKLKAIHLVPSMCEALIAVPDLDHRDVSSLHWVTISGAAASESLLQRVETILKTRVGVAYGMTEFPAMSIATSGAGPGAVGRLIAGVQARIVDEDGTEAPPGKVGAIEVKGPWAFSGYYNQPEETTRALHDGWIRTGDLGYFDAANQLYLAGRSKDIIAQGAVKIFPREVEETIGRLDGVRECAVIGVTDPFLGEAAIAFVVTAEGSALTAEDVLAHCRSHLDPRKSPVRVQFLNDLPKSDLGKVRHVELRARAVEERQPHAEQRAPLVIVRAGERRVPLFVMHPIGGDVTAYGSLFSSLPEDQPIYAIQSRARGAPEREHATLDAMAIDYASIVQSVRARGPYRLMGWSMGALVAHAVACELERRGEEVDLVGLIDPYVRRDVDPHDSAFAALTAIYAFNPSPPPMRAILRELDTLGSQDPTLTWCEDHGLMPKGTVSQRAFDAELRLLSVHRKLVLDHRPRICNAPLTIWWATARSGSDAWVTRTRGTITTAVIGGDHFTMMQPPRVEAIAAAISLARERAPQSEISELVSRIRGLASERDRLDLLEDHLRKIVAAMVRSSVDKISSSAPLKSLGVDSVMVVSLKNALEVDLKVSISAASLYAHPTIGRLAKYLYGQLPGIESRGARARSAEIAPAPDRQPTSLDEPIAIVGLAHRFPTPPDHRGTFWDLLAQGRDAAREVPIDRWDAAAYYDPDPRAPHKSTTKQGNFLIEDVRAFDANFFGIAPVEAQAMDPQQRLALEVAWEAIEHAGITLAELQERRAGIFFGVMGGEYGSLASAVDLADLPEELLPFWATGTAASVVAGRISYSLGMTGPSVAVDTACSSSLVATHLACRELRAGACDVVLAGGVMLILSPASLILGSKLSSLSPDGKCRSFDASGNGFGRGEGCGIVVLKRLSDAVRDGDRILATIVGSAVNQSGSSSGLTSPNPLAQARVIRDALAVARVAPDAVQYVETHGTGTLMGDPVEIEGLTEVFGSRTGAKLRIGSVKTNVGHLEAAAGIAALIKTVLAMTHRELPASLHFNTPNPQVSWDKIPISVQKDRGSWPNPQSSLIAGVSAFGISGTNAHLVVREADPLSKGAQHDGATVLTVSAKTPEALRAHAERFATYLSKPREQPFTLYDVGFTSCTRRTHLQHRLAVVGATSEDWVTRLRAFAKGEIVNGLVAGEAAGRKKIAFLFCDHGQEWFAMGRDLAAREPVFRNALQKCANEMAKHVSWSLLDELGRDETHSRMHETEIAQPALFALQVALAETWRKYGVTPVAVAGHGVGEIAAAHVAGILELGHAARLACLRGRLQQMAIGAENSGQELAAALSFLRPQAAHIHFISTFTPNESATADASYWSKQLTAPVRFEEACRVLSAIPNIDTFVEIGPNPVLIPALESIMSATQHKAHFVPSFRRDHPEYETLLEATAALHCHGHDVDWSSVYRERGRVAPLPAYPWQRERYWIPERAKQTTHAAVVPDTKEPREQPTEPVSVADKLCAIMAQVLGLPRVDVGDNFVRLGGNSLFAMQIVSRVRATFRVKLTVRALFDAPTMQAIAAEIERRS